MGMPTVALVLRGNNNAIEGSILTVYVRIILNRKPSYISTKVKITRKQWDVKNSVVVSHPSAQQFNVKIRNVYNKVLQNINKQDMEGSSYTSKSLKSVFGSNDQHNIFNFVEKYSKDVRSKRELGTITNYDKHVRKLEEFHGSRNLTFEEIDVDFLNRYENYLRTEGKVGKIKEDMGLGNNYVHLLLRTLRTFFNAARKQKIITVYPFDTYEFPSYQAKIKDYLTLSELAMWESFADETPNGVLKQTAIYFLLGCYTGLRISDWKVFSIEKHIVDNRLLLRATKNKEWVSMEISKPLARTINRIKQTPLTIEEPTLNEKLKVIAGKLGIMKKLTSHSGRHTFAITLCAEMGMSSENCANLMGITVKTCIDNYYRVTRDKLDSATRHAWKNLT